MLLRKIAKTAFDALPDVMKVEYKPNPTNADEYLLDAEDAREAIAARDREKARADAIAAEVTTLTAQVKTLTDAAAAIDDDKARKAKDVDALDASYKKKMEDAAAAAKVLLDAANAKLTALLVNQKALALATEISITPDLLAPIIAARLAANLDGENATTRVLDASGQPSALSIEDLKKEIIANPAYKAIIKAKVPSGGGAGGAGDQGGGAPTDKKFADMTGAERTALYNSDPTTFHRLSEENRAAARAGKQ